jgi:hypothetical protein
MKIGVWFDLGNPPGWRQDPARLAAFALERCEEAALFGADSLWFSEHHGFEDGPMRYFLFGTPEEVAAAIAGYTGDAPGGDRAGVRRLGKRHHRLGGLGQRPGHLCRHPLGPAALSAVIPGLLATAAPNADTLGHRQVERRL